MDKLTSTRPYLARALYDWMEDNSLTPYVLVDATNNYVHVPQQYVKDGRIVLNICSSAVRDLFITNEAITFSARFGGAPMDIYIPAESLLAIYARENGKGMFFEQDGDVEPPPSVESQDGGVVNSTIRKPEAVKGRPSLKVVK